MSSIKKNYLYNTFYQIITLIVPIITTPYLSRVLLSDGVGVYSYAYSVTSYFIIFIMLGVANYGSRVIAQSNKNSQELSLNFYSIYYFQLFMGIIVCCIYVLYILFVSRDKTICLIMGLNLIAAIFDVSWFIFGLELFKIVSIRNTIIRILTTLLIFLFVNNKSDVWIYCFIMAGSNLICQICVWPVILKKITFVAPNFEQIKKHIKPNVFLFLTIVAVSIYKIMDKIMLGAMTNKSQVGFYELSERIIAIPNMLIFSLGTVMLPRMSSIISEGKGEDSAYFTIIKQGMAFSMFVASPMCFGIMGVSKEFVPFFYGSGYEVCGVLYIILLPSCIFMSFANVIRTQYLLPNKQDASVVISGILGAISNLCMNFILIPKYLSIGAAIATLTAEIIVCLYQSFVANKSLPIGEYVKTSIPFVTSGLLVFCVTFFFKYSFLNNVYIILFAKILVGGIMYFVGLVMWLIFSKKFRKFVISSLNPSSVE